jgi:polyphenol oxidase
MNFTSPNQVDMNNSTTKDSMVQASADTPVFLPDWTLPPGVQALGTMRAGGVSSGKYASLNVGARVGDDIQNVLENRRRLLTLLAGADRLCFVNQVHGDIAHLESRVASTDRSISDEQHDHARHFLPEDLPEADALVTHVKGLALVIQTADCLPVYFASTDGALVGLAHAGWRGLASGVLENTVKLMRQQAVKLGTSEKIIAAFGPAIGPQKFEVGAEVRAAFVAKKNDLAELFFKPGAQSGKYLANLYGLASLRLGAIGVDVTGQCRHCTVSEPEFFFSYRRDGQTGRQASAIWIS